MRNWKRIAATVLAVSMMVSSTMMVSMAATPEGTWKLDEETGDWYYLDADGDFYEDTIISETRDGKEVYFYVDDDGIMVTDEWVEYDEHMYYATSSGQLAQNRWVLTEDYDDEGSGRLSWYYFKNSGKMMRNDFKTDGHGTYYLGEDGKMISDELLEVKIEDEENPENIETRLIYAYPDGHLAKNEWVILDSEEKILTYNEVEGDWYFFNGKGCARQGDAFEINGKYALFDDEGIMQRATWDENDEYYYEMSGFRMMPTRSDEEDEFFKWRFTDRGWFAFNEEGHAQEFQVASGSNAPHPRVYDVQFIADDDVDLTEVPVGEVVELTFAIEMDIKGAEKKEFRKGHHDIWVEKTFEGNDTPKLFANSTRVKQKEVVNVEDGIAQITYTYEATLPGTTEVKLIVDGVDSNGATITTIETPEPVSAATVNDLLNPENPDDVVGFEQERIDALKALVNEDNEKAEENKEVLFAVFANNESSVSTLESSYKMAKGIEVTAPEVSEEAKALLKGSNTVASVIGVALNMEDSGTAQMKIGEGEEKELDKEFEKTASFDISVEVDGENVSEFTTPIIIKISVPDGFDPNKLVIYHFHGDSDEAEELDFTVDGNVISIVVDQLSTFVFAEGGDTTGGDDNSGELQPEPDNGDDDDDEPQYTSKGSSSETTKEETVKAEETTPGQWIQNATGWWFRFEDGSYPVNEWRKLSYNGKTDWYRFNAEGYMTIGWFTAADGNIYYLNPLSNGLQGAMLTGWQFIDGFWYYFNPIDNAIQGAMYKDTTTPDGYQVDANGRWIQ